MGVDVTEAIRTWDDQTQAVKSAPQMEPQNIETALANLPKAHEQVELLPLDEPARKLVHAAIDRFAAALRERPEAGS